MKNNLIVESIDSSDINDELGLWTPSNSREVYIYVYIVICEKETGNRCVFETSVATPLGLHKYEKLADLNLLSDRNLLVYKEFSWKQLQHDVKTIVSACRSSSWQLSVEKLQRYFRWEYEEQYYKSLDH